MPKISEKSLQILKSYLEDHSVDIVDEENDFGDLREVYQELCKEEKVYWILYGLFISYPKKEKTWAKLKTYKNYDKALLDVKNNKDAGIITHGYMGYKIIQRVYHDKTVFDKYPDGTDRGEEQEDSL